MGYFIEPIVQIFFNQRASRIIVRQPQCYANSGDYVNGMPFSLTLCGTWGGNTASEEVIFGKYWKKFGT
jgi:sulfoacetaldehyde dehydrogenase